MSRIQGLDALNKKLRRMPVEAKVEIRKALNESADRIVALAHGLAPVDQGDLRQSIRKEAGRHELAVRILAGGDATTRPVRQGATAPRFDYAAAAEARSPFFYPAYRALRKSIRARLGRAYRKAAKGGRGAQ